MTKTISLQLTEQAGMHVITLQAPDQEDQQVAYSSEYEAQAAMRRVLNMARSNLHVVGIELTGRVVMDGGLELTLEECADA